MKAFFVTGTDTEVGKTFVSGALLQQSVKRGKRAIGFKPVASGCERTVEGLRNSDALTLQASGEPVLKYEEVNPFSFEEAIAPHIAAKRAQTCIDVKRINQAYLALTQKDADILIVEGAGGWRLPLGNGQFMSEFVAQQQLPVVIVVGMKLGCLNHAKLTEEAILNDGLKVAGWVANHIQPDMPYLAENIASLHEMMLSPCLGEIPWSDTGEPDASKLSLDWLCPQ